MSSARERLVSVLVVLALGGLAVLTSTQPFASLELAGEGQVGAVGSAVAPVLAPLGIVAVALAAALTIAGRIARRVLGGVLVLLGAGVVLAVLPAGLDPASGIGAAVTARIGITGARSLASLTAGTVGTAWPWVGVVDGVLLAAAGVAVLVRAGRWPAGGRRFRRTAPVVPSTSDPVAEWDALSAGADPTEAADR